MKNDMVAEIREMMGNETDDTMDLPEGTLERAAEMLADAHSPAEYNAMGEKWLPLLIHAIEDAESEIIAEKNSEKEEKLTNAIGKLLYGAELSRKPGIRKPVAPEVAVRLPRRYVLPVKDRSGRVEAYFIDKKANVRYLRHVASRERSAAKGRERAVAAVLHSEKVATYVVVADVGCFMANGRQCRNDVGDGTHQVNVFRLPPSAKDIPPADLPSRLCKRVAAGWHFHILADADSGEALNLSGGLEIRYYDCDPASPVVCNLKNVKLAIVSDGDLFIWVAE